MWQQMTNSEILPVSAPHHLQRTLLSLLLATSLLLLFFALRLPGLANFPLFVDEATHLFAAEGVLRDSSPLFQVWLGRQFTILWYALFGAPLAAPAFVARFATLLIVLLGAAAVSSIGRRFGGRSGMLLAILLYTFSAYHLFFERLALADNITGGAILLATWFAMRLRTRVNLGDALLVGALLFIAFGAKVSALPYFGIPIAAAAALTPRGRPLTLTLRWVASSLGTALVLTFAFIFVVRWRGMDVMSNSLSLAISARGTPDLGVLLSPERIVGNVMFTVSAVAPYWSGIFLFLSIGVAVLLLRRQFYLPLVIFAPLLPIWISTVQETRFLVSALALFVTGGAIGIVELLKALPSRYQPLGVLTVILLALPVWWAIAQPLYMDPTALRLPEPDAAQYMLSDASGFNLRESAAAIVARGDMVSIIGAMANCQALRYMTLGDLPVVCPPISPNPATGDALLVMLQTQTSGVYLILERIPYIPQEVPGTFVTEINAPIARPPLAIYRLGN